MDLLDVMLYNCVIPNVWPGNNYFVGFWIIFLSNSSVSSNLNLDLRYRTVAASSYSKRAPLNRIITFSNTSPLRQTIFPFPTFDSVINLADWAVNRFSFRLVSKRKKNFNRPITLTYCLMTSGEFGLSYTREITLNISVRSNDVYNYNYYWCPCKK